MSFYECLKAFPEGSASASRLALTAKRLGYQGIIICNQEPDKIFMPQAAEMIKGIDVAIGAEVTAAEQQGTEEPHLCSAGKISISHGSGSDRGDQSGWPAEDPNVDLLIHPCEDGALWALPQPERPS